MDKSQEWEICTFCRGKGRMVSIDSISFENGKKEVTNPRPEDCIVCQGSGKLLPGDQSPSGPPWVETELSRPWVREHRGHPPLWHYYIELFKPALCGLPPMDLPFIFQDVPPSDSICHACASILKERKLNTTPIQTIASHITSLVKARHNIKLVEEVLQHYKRIESDNLESIREAIEKARAMDDKFPNQFYVSDHLVSYDCGEFPPDVVFVKTFK